MFSITTRVRYQETDKGGRVYHSNYLVWLDMARTEYLRSKGIVYAELEDAGYFLVVKEINLNYRASARFDDEVRIDITKIIKQKFRVDFHYNIVHNLDDKLMVSAFVQVVCINKSGKPIIIPNMITEIIKE